MLNFKINDPHFLPHIGCDLELKFSAQQPLILVGENGLGKSTLLKRIYQDFQESVLIEQKAIEHFYDRSLIQFKKIFLSSTSADAQRFEMFWNSFEMQDREDRKLSTLSGGENQILKLCCGLAQEAQLYLLDEPSQFLDGGRKEKLNKLLIDFVSKEKSLVLVEHDLDWISPDWRVEKLIVEDNCLRKGS
jgi:ABC-type Mn2+/Zn2+ transport system ATPase subunit